LVQADILRFKKPTNAKPETVVRQCKADPQMAHLVFADKRVNAPKTKRAIFCQRTERLSELKM
jgi:hypothetical protein